VGFARIFNIQPKVVVADEPTSMLDVSVQAQVLRLMKDLQNETGVAYVFISHEPDAMSIMCDEVIWIDRGNAMTYDHFSFLDRVSASYEVSI
jgi:peptide/nickel transport system ATP-binding protein